MVMHTQKHPGFLLKEMLNQTDLSITRTADRLGVSRTALSRLLNGHAGISPEMALRLSQFFNTSVEMWINLQANYDIYLIKKSKNRFKIVPLAKAA